MINLVVPALTTKFIVTTKLDLIGQLYQISYAGLDIFCQDSPAYQKHFRAQVKLFKSEAERRSQDLTETFLNVFAKEDQYKCAREMSDKMFGPSSRLLYGNMGRDITRMYIFRKMHQSKK